MVCLKLGLWSGNSNFRLRLSRLASRIFGSSSNIFRFLAPAPAWFGPLKVENLVVFAQLACPKASAVKPESKFQVPAPTSESFGSDSGSSHSKLLGLRLHSPVWNYSSQAFSKTRLSFASFHPYACACDGLKMHKWREIDVLETLFAVRLRCVVLVEIYSLFETKYA